MAATNSQKWHSLKLNGLLYKLGTREEGLSAAEAGRRLAEGGKNSIGHTEAEPWYSLLFSQMSSLPIIMLLAAAAISFGLGFTVDEKKLLDGIAITVAVAIAVFFGFFQEYKAERALEALRKMVVLRSVVIRGGKDYSIDSSELVVGDIVLLEEGSRIPADMRLLEATNLAVDQSMLTGESHASKKEVCVLPEKTHLSDQSNLIFSGTIIVRGHCKGVVVATGMATEFGKIVGIVATTKEGKTPLQESLAGLSRALGIAGIIFASLFFIIGIARGETAVNMFVVGVTLAVAVIPEGLPTVLAITLAIGVQKMARKNAIVRKMAAVETLGSATVICTDKTGTITRNRMEVQEIVLLHKTYGIEQGALNSEMVRRDRVLSRALEASILCNNAILVDSDGKQVLSGDPTETALLSAAMPGLQNYNRLRLEHRVIAEVPFDSNRKMMSTIRAWGKERVAFVKGAPEKVLSRCSKVLAEKGAIKMTQEHTRYFTSEAHSLGKRGMRVLALAYRPIEKLSSYSSSNTERSLVFVGLVGMEDPPRPEVASAIALCKSAGIRVIMVTGDSVHTAQAIASKIGLLSEGQSVVDGPELEDMGEEELRTLLPRAGVFARTTPEQKFRIISALQGMGEIVAVTGDGVNDAPALKKANIGVAMGLTGTDVSKEVAEIVLTDDNFASIVNAVRYGRVTFNNIKAFVRYQLSTNVAALSLMFSAPALSLPLPLYPLQILWINIMVDGPPALALGLEPSSHDEMEKPPRNSKDAFLTRNLVLSIVFTGLMMAAISISVYLHYLSSSPEKAVTATFTLFVFLQLINALSCRSAHRSIFSRTFSNPYIFLAIIASLALHMAIVYLPALQPIFKTVPLAGADLALLACAAAIILLFEELKKKYFPSSTVY